MLLSRAHWRKYLFFRFSNVTAWSWWKPWRRRPLWQRRNFNRWCHQPEHQSLPVSGLTSMENTEGDCRLHHPIIADQWSCWQGVCNSWLLNVFPPHKLACRSPQVANCWASTQVELLNFWGSTQVIPIFQCWLMLGSSGRCASWRGKTKTSILLLCWSRNNGRV